MSKFTVPFTDLQTPLTEKSRAKLIGHLNKARRTQDAAATATLQLWIADFDGVLGDAHAAVGATAAAGESMVVDLLKNGVSVLTGTLTQRATGRTKLHWIANGVQAALEDDHA